MTSRILALALLSLAGAVCSCGGQAPIQQSSTMSQQVNFNWGACLTAPRDFPVELHSGYFANASGFTGALVNNGVQAHGWQEEGTTGGMGGAQVPSILSLTWVSYAEKKFWKLDATIDSARMLALFQRGFDQTDRLGHTSHATYKRIVVGLAPGGVVVVWLAGPLHRAEVGRYQAKETQVAVNDFVPVAGAFKDNSEFFEQSFRNALKPESQERVRRSGIPYGLWDEYRKKYHWRISIRFYSDDQEGGLRELTLLNGKRNVISVREAAAFRKESAPYHSTFYFKQKWAEAYFDDEELIKACKELTKVNSDEQIDIIGKVEFMYKNISFVAKTKELEIRLNKVKVRVWNN